MRIGKNRTAKLFAALYFCCGNYALGSALAAMGAQQADPCLSLGLVTAVLCGVLLAAWAVCTLCARGKCPQWGQKHPMGAAALEWGLGAAILLAALWLRLLYARQVPLLPDSGGNTCLEIARLRMEGTLLTEGGAYCDEIARSPALYGYTGVLALAFRLFGVSQWTGRLVNIFCGVLVSFFLWRSASALAGPGPGMAALVLSAFWPARIAAEVFLTPEPLRALLLFFSLWLFLRLTQADLSDGGPQVGLVLGHLGLGVLLAIAAALTPAGVLLLAAMLLYLAQAKAALPLRPASDLPVSARAMAKGWIRAALVLGLYLFASALISKTVSYQIDRPLAAGGIGAFFRQVFAQLRSPGAPETLLHKFGGLWSGDAVWISETRTLLAEQGSLTPALQTLLGNMEIFQMAAYPVLLGLSVAAALVQGQQTCVPVTVCAGLFLLSPFAEDGGAYRAYALYLFMLLVPVLLRELYQRRRDALAGITRAEVRAREEAQAEAQALERIQEAQRYCEELQKQKMAGQFDMLTALREGHVRVSVSQAVREDWENAEKASKPPKDET